MSKRTGIVIGNNKMQQDMKDANKWAELQTYIDRQTDQPRKWKQRSL